MGAFLQAIGLQKRPKVTSASAASSEATPPAAPTPPTPPTPPAQPQALPTSLSARNAALQDVAPDVEPIKRKDGGMVEKELLRRRAAVKQKRGC